MNGILREGQHDDPSSNAHTTAKQVIPHRGLHESGFEMYKLINKVLAKRAKSFFFSFFLVNLQICDFLVSVDVVIA